MEITFLGTGPTGGVKGRGKSNRSESSLLIETSHDRVLIDVTNFFSKQAKWINDIDVIFITHAHKDAIGGINQLITWMYKRKINGISLYSHHQTVKRIQNQFKKIDPLILTAIESGHAFQIGDITVTPFLVKHSIQPGFPTLGFHFLLDGKRLVYISDTSGWNKKAEYLMKNADILIIDGAMWGKRMVAHLDIREVLPKICKWPVKKIIFTQIGHTAPKHEILQKEIKKICPKAQPAFDDMVIKT